MRDILITGGAGKIGFNLVEKLLETNYSITILDLESKDSLKKQIGIKYKVKFVYGDVEDKNLVRDLVKRNDIVIDYAGVMPPLANLNEELSNSTNFVGTKNIVDSINEVNPECRYIYMSFISVYGDIGNSKRLITSETESNHPDDFYSVSLIRSEDYIKENVKNYAIFRMPIVLTSRNYYINHIMPNKEIDVISRSSLNDIIIDIMQNDKVLGGTYNIAGVKVNSNDLIRSVYKYTGELSILNRKLYYGEFEEDKKLKKLSKTKLEDSEEAFKAMSRLVSSRRRIFKKIINLFKYFIFANFISKSK